MPGAPSSVLVARVKLRVEELGKICVELFNERRRKRKSKTLHLKQKGNLFNLKKKVLDFHSVRKVL